MRSRWATPVIALAAVGAAATGLAASAAGGGRGESGSGIRGSVVPCGLVHERPSGCAFSPAGARIVVRRAAGGPQIGAARADAHGRFRVAMGPGRYLVEAHPKGAGGAAPVQVRAVVPAHGWVSVIVPAGRTAPPQARLVRG
jgi:hypothetical protein